MEKQARETIPVDQLAITNANIMAAFLEVLEEKGVVRKGEVLAKGETFRKRLIRSYPQAA